MITHLLTFLIFATPLPHTEGSFTTAKKRALEVTTDHRKTLYCDCEFLGDKTVAPKKCGYTPRKMFTSSGKVNVRAKRIEWEHVVAAYRMGKDRKCWRDKTSFPECQRSSGSWLSSRQCCRKVDPVFKAMENDLHNLWPAIGELNADRSNKPYNTVIGESRDYGKCDFEVSKDAAEVREDIRGEVARAYLYMAKVWGLTLSTGEAMQFRAWNLADPPDAWELERERRIAALQGVGNDYVSQHPSVHEGRPCVLRENCCRVCSTSKPCGNGCISKKKTCSKEPGCACARSDLCPE